MNAIANSRPQKTVSARLTRSIQSPELKHDKLVTVSRSRFTGTAGGGIGVAPAGLWPEDEKERDEEWGLMVSQRFSAFSAATTLTLDEPDRKLLLWEQKIKNQKSKIKNQNQNQLFDNGEKPVKWMNEPTRELSNSADFRAFENRRELRFGGPPKISSSALFFTWAYPSSPPSKSLESSSTGRKQIKNRLEALFICDRIKGFRYCNGGRTGETVGFDGSGGKGRITSHTK